MVSITINLALPAGKARFYKLSKPIAFPSGKAIL